MKNQLKLTAVAILATISFISCEDENEVKAPVEIGATVEVRNTFESAYYSTFPGFEIFASETPFGDTLTSKVSTSLEFDKYLGLYSINIDNNTISYQLVDVAPENIQFREIEEGTFDRYYFMFDSAQAFKAAAVDDEFVTVTILSDKALKVEIGAGYDFTSGHSFQITLTN